MHNHSEVSSSFPRKPSAAVIRLGSQSGLTTAAGLSSQSFLQKLLDSSGKFPELDFHLTEKLGQFTITVPLGILRILRVLPSAVRQMVQPAVQVVVLVGGAGGLMPDTLSPPLAETCPVSRL